MMAKKDRVDVLELYPKPPRVRPYEMVFLVHPDLEEKAVQDLVKRIQERIEQVGGKVTKIDFWGKRLLAYPIRKRRDAHYVLMHFQVPAQGMQEVQRFLRFQEPIMRHLIVRLDED